MATKTKEAATTNANATLENSISRIEVLLRGMDSSRLVVHNFGEKAKQEIRQKQQKAARAAKAARDVHAEFLAARYVNEFDQECIPVTAVKKAIISAAPAFDSITKVGLRQAFFVSGVQHPNSLLVPIENPDNGADAVGTIREDAVTIGINTRGLSYRPEYLKWQVRIGIEFCTRLISEEQLLALIDHAGWGVGICEGRPERTSALGWGRFRRCPWPTA